MRRLLAAPLLLAGLLLAGPLLVGPGAPALAVMPDEVLGDPALETRARAISRDLRCLVCQNQSIDDSNAPLARDLRLLVRERLSAGDGDAEVVDYVVRRYGDYVLLRPPFKASTYALWLGPAAILLVAGAGMAVYLRNRRRDVMAGDAAPLDDEERRRLDRLLGREG